MQEDMHYYGTYAMARSAGLEQYACKVIATAAQFVDDHANTEGISFQDGARIDTEATAHHVASFILNNDERDQRLVWVPFHFLPGNEGDSYHESMVCRKNSEIAQKVVKHCLSKHAHPYALALLGITAHVYADTFSHHGFSGFSSDINKVDAGSFKFDKDLHDEIKGYIQGKFEQFLFKYGGSNFAESSTHGLGHGSVATFPDRPYLKWSFVYENNSDVRIERDNPSDFLEGCEALYAMFKKFKQLESSYSDGDGKEFPDIKELVEGVLNVQAEMSGRIDAWQSLARSGDIFSTGGEEIPPYDPDKWVKEFKNFQNAETSEDAISMPMYHFYQGAAIHRTFVLRELLPSYNLVAH